MGMVKCVGMLTLLQFVSAISVEEAPKATLLTCRSENRTHVAILTSNLMSKDIMT